MCEICGEHVPFSESLFTVDYSGYVHSDCWYQDQFEVHVYEVVTL